MRIRREGVQDNMQNARHVDKDILISELELKRLYQHIIDLNLKLQQLQQECDYYRNLYVKSTK